MSGSVASVCCGPNTQKNVRRSYMLLLLATLSTRTHTNTTQIVCAKIRKEITNKQQVAARWCSKRAGRKIQANKRYIQKAEVRENFVCVCVCLFACLWLCVCACVRVCVCNKQTKLGENCVKFHSLFKQLVAHTPRALSACACDCACASCVCVCIGMWQWQRSDACVCKYLFLLRNFTR